MDREKVIKGLQNLRDAIATDFIHEADQAVGTIDDAIAMLKKQGEHKFFADESGNITPLPVVVRCKNCRYGQYCTDGETTYQCFKWNSGEFGMLHEQDWFCADGEKAGT